MCYFRLGLFCCKQTVQVTYMPLSFQLYMCKTAWHRNNNWYLQKLISSCTAVCTANMLSCRVLITLCTYGYAKSTFCCSAPLSLSHMMSNELLPINQGLKFIFLTLPSSDWAAQSSHWKCGKHRKTSCLQWHENAFVTFQRFQAWYTNHMVTWLTLAPSSTTSALVLILKLIINTAQLRFYHCQL